MLIAADIGAMLSITLRFAIGGVFAIFIVLGVVAAIIYCITTFTSSLNLNFYYIIYDKYEILQEERDILSTAFSPRKPLPLFQQDPVILQPESTLKWVLTVPLSILFLANLQV